MNELSTRSRGNTFLTLVSGAAYGYGAPKLIAEFVYYWGAGLRIGIEQTATTASAILGAVLFVVLLLFDRKTATLFLLGSILGFVAIPYALQFLTG